MTHPREDSRVWMSKPDLFSRGNAFFRSFPQKNVSTLLNLDNITDEVSILGVLLQKENRSLISQHHYMPVTDIYKMMESWRNHPHPPPAMPCLPFTKRGREGHTRRNEIYPTIKCRLVFVLTSFWFLHRNIKSHGHTIKIGNFRNRSLLPKKKILYLPTRKKKQIFTGIALLHRETTLHIFCISYAKVYIGPK